MSPVKTNRGRRSFRRYRLKKIGGLEEEEEEEELVKLLTDIESFCNTKTDTLENRKEIYAGNHEKHDKKTEDILIKINKVLNELYSITFSVKKLKNEIKVHPIIGAEELMK
jgi:hypothetical protein